MKMSVSLKNGASGLPWARVTLAALSRDRTDVVPTAITRPPRARVAAMASTTSCGTSAYSECMW
ncbi:hypothetical protein D3C73_1532680 [compost metagenome]